MNFKKLIVLFLSVIAIFCFASCKEDIDENVNETNTENESVETDALDYTKDLVVEDYEGYNFRILIRPGKVSDQYLEEDSDDSVESAVYKRNQTVEQMYNIKITATESSNANRETDALTAILAGDDAYDMILPHTASAFVYAVQDALINLNEVSSIQKEKPWWSQDIIDSFNVNNHLYIIDGDISTHRLKYAMCMYFNKRIFDELGIEYPYELVKNGEWTFDNFEDIVKQGAKDLNGDGVMNPADDQYGYVAHEWQTPISIIYTGGQKICDKNEQGIPELTLNSSKTVDIYDTFFNLCDHEACFLFYDGMPIGGNPFPAGRAMISDGNLGDAKNFRNMDDDFGILPLPKFTSEDDYATTVNGYAHVVVMPNTVEDPEKTGAIIEALCAIGSRDVLPAFYDVSLKTKYSRDTESEAMIDIIRNSIIYDIGYCSGGTFQQIGRDLAMSETHDFASTYASHESEALITLSEFNEAYGNVANN